MLKIVLIILLYLALPLHSYTQNSARDNDPSDVEAVFIPRFKFESYKVAVFRGRKAKFNDRISHTASLYRTALKEGYRSQDVNFAGHYILITWGCGAPCVGGAIVDVRDGKVYDVPFSFMGYDFKKNSRLLIANPPFTTNAADKHLAYLVNRGTDIPYIYVFNETRKKFELQFKYKYGE